MFSDFWGNFKWLHQNDLYVKHFVFAVNWRRFGKTKRVTLTYDATADCTFSSEDITARHTWVSRILKLTSAVTKSCMFQGLNKGRSRPVSKFVKRVSPQSLEIRPRKKRRKLLDPFFNLV